MLIVGAWATNFESTIISNFADVGRQGEHMGVDKAEQEHPKNVDDTLLMNGGMELGALEVRMTCQCCPLPITPSSGKYVKHR